MQGLNEFCGVIHKANVEKGFYEIAPTIDRSLMLVIGELSEAHEALRKERFADLDRFEAREKYKNVDQDPEFYAANFEHLIKDTLEDEIADAVIRLFDFCGFKGIDIEKHIDLKLKYNKQRPYKHGKKF